MNSCNIDIKPITYYGYIYKIVDLTNGKIYIGQSRLYKGSVLSISKINNYYGSGIIISKIIYKRKHTLFKSIIDFANNQEELDNLEIKYIKEFNSLKPSGYNIREGGNSTGKYYLGQLNPASKTNMSKEKRVKKALKGIETKRKRGIAYNSWNTGLDMSNTKLARTIHKTHETLRLRGIDRVRIQHGLETKKKNNIFKLAALKTAETIKATGVLKGPNGSNSIHYILISPDGKEIDVNGTLAEICCIYNLTRRLLINNLGSVVPKSYYHTQRSKNTVGWKLIKIGRCRDERISKIKI